MTLIKNKTTEENRRFWQHVEAVVRDFGKLVPSMEPSELHSMQTGLKPEKNKN